MIPKEKAKELINKYKPIVYSIDGYGDYDESIAFVNAKSCAFILIDEIIKNFGTTTNGQTFYTEYSAVQYWEQVKQEIEKL